MSPGQDGGRRDLLAYRERKIEAAEGKQILRIEVVGAEFAAEMLLCFPVFMLTALVLAKVEGVREDCLKC